MTRRTRLVLAGVVALVVAVGAALVFEPWALWTNRSVTEAAPSSVTDPGPEESGPAPTPSASKAKKSSKAKKASKASQATTADKPSVTPEPEPPQDVELAAGDFEAAEHATSGTARVLRLADGRRFVRLEALNTSNGPDLHVWVTDQPSGGSWGSYDDGRYVRLGPLKGNQGDQNYEIPPDADLGGLTSVVIWCDRFNVAFGTAPVRL